jgi:hypothetical protein
MKKRIQLNELEIQSFVTTNLTNEQTRQFNGGFHTDAEPGSGACLECLPTDVHADCGHTTPYLCLQTTHLTGCIP